MLNEIRQMYARPFINTVALARCKRRFRLGQLFQQFATLAGKPLKRLAVLGAQLHRAKATVLMRGPSGTCEIFTLIIIFLLLACCGCGQNAGKSQTNPPPAVTFKPQEMADALHAVIAADREVYCRYVVQRLDADEKLVKTSENWRQDHALPVPAQVLRMGSEAVQQKGAEFHYVLRSLW